MKHEAAISRLFASQHGVVTRRQALALGFPHHRIDHLVKKRVWQPVHPGVYRLAGSPETWHQRLLAACLAAGTGALASHRVAAVLWDLRARPAQAEITVPRSVHLRIPGVTVHRILSLERRDAQVIDRIPVTSITRTIIDMAAVSTHTELETLLDEALTRRLIDARSLARRLEDLGTRGRKGTQALSQLLADRPDGPRAHESAFETQLAKAIRRSGLPAPVPQFRVRLPSGRAARIDFAYPKALLAIEADSYRYHSSISSWSRDRERNNELIALGWRILPVTFQALRADPATVANQVAQCLHSTDVWRPVGK